MRCWRAKCASLKWTRGKGSLGPSPLMPAALTRPRFSIRPYRLRPFLLQHAEPIRNPGEPVFQLNPFVRVIARRARGGRRHREQMHRSAGFLQHRRVIDGLIGCGRRA